MPTIEELKAELVKAKRKAYYYKDRYASIPRYDEAASNKWEAAKKEVNELLKQIKELKEKETRESDLFEYYDKFKEIAMQSPGYHVPKYIKGVTEHTVYVQPLCDMLMDETSKFGFPYVVFEKLIREMQKMGWLHVGIKQRTLPCYRIKFKLSDQDEEFYGAWKIDFYR